MPEREGILRAIDGQHRLLALHAALDQIGDEPFTVPAIIFDQLPEDHIVQMFVTINAKHTRLNASHLVSLSGRQLYRDDNLAAAHDVVRALNDREDSPLYQQIKLLGVGRGKVAQAPLAQELKKLFCQRRVRHRSTADDFREESKQFFVNYLKQVAQVFGAAWNGRKVQHPHARRRCARSSASRPTSSAGSTRSAPTARTSAPSAASSRPGGAGSATCGSRRKAPGSATARRWSSSPRSSGSRCNIRKARASRPRVTTVTRRVVCGCKFDTNCKLQNGLAGTIGRNSAIFRGREGGMVLAIL